MVGPPGAGKSVGAKAISEELRLPLLRCDMGRIFAGLVGASEDNARKVIQTADAVSPASSGWTKSRRDSPGPIAVWTLASVLVFSAPFDLDAGKS